MSAARRHGCAFCLALQRLAIRRRKLGLIDAAERLSDEHLAADEERQAFTRSPPRGGTPAVTKPPTKEASK